MASKVKKPDADKPLYSTVIVVDLGSAKFLADFRSLVDSMSEASNGFPEELRRALLENLSRIRKIVSKQQKGNHLVCALLAMKGRFFNPYAFDPFKSDSVETLEAIAHALAGAILEAQDGEYAHDVIELTENRMLAFALRAACYIYAFEEKRGLENLDSND
jgi:hypothetical protein